MKNGLVVVAVKDKEGGMEVCGNGILYLFLW